jgi:hypothetical protein
MKPVKRKRSMRMEVREVEKLALCREGLTSAYRAGMILQEKGWTMYPAPSWKEPAVLAFAGETCVAGVNWSRDENDGSANVDFAWCSPDHPTALTSCLLRLRERLRQTPPSWLSFTCHRGNEPMEKLVGRLKLEQHSAHYRVPKDFYEQKRPAEGTKTPFINRLRNAVVALRG